MRIFDTASFYAFPHIVVFSGLSNKHLQQLMLLRKKSPTLKVLKFSTGQKHSRKIVNILLYFFTLLLKQHFYKLFTLLLLTFFTIFGLM